MMNTASKLLWITCLVVGACDLIRPPDPPAPTCNDLGAMARQTITNAAQSVQQCATKADCRFVNLGFDIPCVDCLHIIGSDAVRDAINAQSEAITRTCKEFKDAGCRIIPSGCPGLSLEGVECQQGRCVFPRG
jgi:hypothetical protein